MEVNPQALQLSFLQCLKRLLDWWISKMVDEENGGFYGRMDSSQQLYPKAHKGVIMNTRILWTFAAASRITGNANYRRMADRAFHYLETHFLDPQAGGVFWMLDYQGKVVESKKQIYAQAFAIYAYSEYFLLHKDQSALNRALGIFDLIEQHSRDVLHGGYQEALDRHWHPMEDVRLSERDLNAAKTMNTHLHVLEAYTNLARAVQSDRVQRALSHLIQLYIEKFIDQRTGHLHTFFTDDWQLLSKEVSFGHDIESSWLLWEAAEVLGEEALLQQLQPVILQMAETTLNEGVDTDGALWNERHPDGTIDTEKNWWPQAEAVIGFWNAWQWSGERHYRSAALAAWSYIQQNLITPQGEWYWSVDATGKPNPQHNLAGPWKAPYHNGRMCMEMIKRIKSWA